MLLRQAIRGLSVIRTWITTTLGPRMVTATLSRRTHSVLCGKGREAVVSCRSGPVATTGEAMWTHVRHHQASSDGSARSSLETRNKKLRRYLSESKWTLFDAEIWDMRVHGEVMGAQTLHMVVTSLVTRHEVKKALELLYRMIDEPVTPLLITFVVLIHACVKSSLHHEAIATFDLLWDMGLAPSLDTFNSVLFSVSRVGDVGKFRAILNMLVKEGIRPDAETFENFVYLLGRSGKTSELPDVLDMMECNRVLASMTLVTAIADACVYDKDPAMGVRLLSELQRRKMATIRPAALVKLLHASFQYNNVGAVFDLVRQLEAVEVPLNMQDWICIIQVCCRARKPEIAWPILQGMMKRRAQLTESAWNRILQAYTSCRAAKYAFQCRLLMQESGIHPDHSAYERIVDAMCLDRSLTTRESLEMVTALVANMWEEKDYPNDSLCIKLVSIYACLGHPYIASSLLDQLECIRPLDRREIVQKALKKVPPKKTSELLPLLLPS